MFKPMLAATLKDEAQLKFPLLASPKLDGIRTIVKNGVLLSRNMKPIPNRFVQETILPRKVVKLLEHFDGELIVGSATAEDVFNKTTSAVMTHDKPCQVVLHAFDYAKEELRGTPFIERFSHMKKLIQRAYESTQGTFAAELCAVPHRKIEDMGELLTMEIEALKIGYEGLMLRSIDGPYKWGRATAGEGFLLKLKRFHDSEAIVIGYDELMSNANEQTKDELGRAKRSTHKANMVPLGTLGALAVRDLKTGVEFNIGSGFDDTTRRLLWGRRKTLKGIIVKYKYFPVGVKEKPRFPVFLGIRDARDL